MRKIDQDPTRKLRRRIAELTGDCCRNCEPLTPDDIAEVIVFAAGRRENVVIADSLIFPSHQVSYWAYCSGKLEQHGLMN